MRSSAEEHGNSDKDKLEWEYHHNIISFGENSLKKDISREIAMVITYF